LHWHAEITEQVPDLKIAWRSISGDAPNAGEVRFEAMGPERTRVHLAMEYEPQGAVENIGDKLGVLSARVQNTVEDFKKYIEKPARAYRFGSERPCATIPAAQMSSPSAASVSTVSICWYQRSS
jgi:uncharacterized membrane protein